MCLSVSYESTLQEDVKNWISQGCFRDCMLSASQFSIVTQEENCMVLVKNITYYVLFLFICVIFLCEVTW